jgi:fucose permease
VPDSNTTQAWTATADAPAGPDAGVSRARVTAARTAVAVVFIANGFGFASWVSRLPAIRDHLHLDPGQLGLVLLFASCGSLSGLPLAGTVVQRVGPARGVALGAVPSLAALALVGLADNVAVLAVALYVMGLGIGIWDVSMNVEAADVERRLGRVIMPRFHAGFSLGTVLGAGAGAGAAGLGLPVTVHLAVVAVAALGTILLACRWFLPVAPARSEEAGSAPKRGIWHAWREPRTLVIGLLVLGMALAEGAANDWVTVGFVDGYRFGHAAAAAGFGVFVSTMTIGRMAGPWLLERYGRVRSLRIEVALVLVGLAGFVGGEVLARASVPAGIALGLAGVAVWGAGAALGFPVGMSAASDDPANAAARVSVVATIGYSAFLAGPPLLGLLGDQVGVVRSMVGVGLAALLAFFAAAAARPPAEPAGDGDVSSVTA